MITLLPVPPVPPPLAAPAVSEGVKEAVKRVAFFTGAVAAVAGVVWGATVLTTRRPKKALAGLAGFPKGYRKQAGVPVRTRYGIKGASDYIPTDSFVTWQEARTSRGVPRHRVTYRGADFWVDDDAFELP